MGIILVASKKKSVESESQKRENPKVVALQPLKLRAHDYSSEQHSDKIITLPVPFFLIGSTSNYFQIKSV